MGQFLRSRRGRLSPAETGLASSLGQRRTPGLRREEVAVLAGIGTSWYTWLEQGRSINVSEPIARAIGQALHLDDCEFNYFYRLLGISPWARAQLRPADPVPANLGHLVDEWLPSPAIRLDGIWNIVEMNLATRLVFGLPEGERNLLVSLFTSDVIRSRAPDFDRMAKVAVAQFRADTVECYDDPAFNDFVVALCDRSEQFASLWCSHEVLDLRHKRKEIDHPQAGRLLFATQTLRLDGPGALRLVLHLPHYQTDTRRKVGMLVARHHRENYRLDCALACGQPGKPRQLVRSNDTAMLASSAATRTSLLAGASAAALE